MSAYTPWTLSSARTIIRQELMDPSAKWWSDGELNQYISDWQNELNQDYELVWGSATVVTALNTITLGSISPAMHRLEAVYYIGTGSGDRGYRLSGRLLQDLEVMNHEWRNATADTPREIIQYDSTQLIVWPPLPQTGTFVFEYPQALSFAGDTSPVSLPPWTQWSMIPYVAHRAYLRPGPTNDPKRSMRYKAQYLRKKQRLKLLWDQWLPERFRRLKPASHYEWDILHPPPAWAGTGGVASSDSYKSFLLSGVDGVNITFTLPILPTALKLFLNGLLQTQGTDFSLAGQTITFTSPPQFGDTLVAWTFTQGS